MTLLLFITGIAVSAFLAGMLGFAAGHARQSGVAQQTIARLQATQVHYARMLTAAHQSIREAMQKIDAAAPAPPHALREAWDDGPTPPHREPVH